VSELLGITLLQRDVDKNGLSRELDCRESINFAFSVVAGHLKYVGFVHLFFVYGWVSAPRMSPYIGRRTLLHLSLLALILITAFHAGA
jgi:hypothetical protein